MINKALRSLLRRRIYGAVVHGQTQTRHVRSASRASRPFPFLSLLSLLSAQPPAYNLSRRVDDDDLSIGSSRAPAGLVWPLVEEGLTRARSSAVKTRSAPPRIRHHHPKLPISVTIMLLLMQSSKLYLRGVVSVGIHGKIVRKQLVWTSSVCENRLVQRTSSV